LNLDIDRSMTAALSRIERPAARSAKAVVRPLASGGIARSWGRLLPRADPCGGGIAGLGGTGGVDKESVL
jgi:hypothetical protein